MSNYNTKEQLNKITQSFSQVFDIKLSKVRHKIAIKEGFTCHESHIDSLAHEQIKIPEKLAFIQSIQKRPGMYLGDSSKSVLFNLIIDAFTSSFKNKYSSSVNIEIDKNEMIKISDNSIGLHEDLFKNEFEDLFSSFPTFTNNKYDENNIRVNFNDLYSLYMLPALCLNFDVAYKEGNNFYSSSFKEGEKIKTSYFNSKIDDGFHIRFKMNEAYLPEDLENFDTNSVYVKLQKLSDLNKNLSLKFKNKYGNTANYYSKCISNIFNDSFDIKEPLLEKTFISKKNDKNMEAEVVFVETRGKEDFECVSYVNDKRMEQGGSHEKGLELYLKEHLKVNKKPSDLKGVKALILLNIDSYDLSNSGLRVVSRKTKKDVYDLLSQ